jgi:uncharacterized protein (DUF1015 family)
MFSPFPGLLFDSDHIGDVGGATSPPYDVISPDQRRELVAASPFNVVNVLLAGPEDPDYEQAGDTMAAWLTEGAIVADDGPHFYLYFMDYVTPEGEARTAKGVLGALDVVAPGAQIVPHEETRAKHRADRMAAMSATRANVDVIIGLSSSPDLLAMLVPTPGPHLDFFAADAVRHRVWKITDRDQIDRISAAVDAHPISIADGHHRYLTALEYRENRSEPGPWDAILALVAPAEGSGLTVGPYHRVFDDFPFTPAAVAAAFDVTESTPEVPSSPGDLVVSSPRGTWRLAPRPEAVEHLPEPWRAASTAIAREVLYPLLGVDEAAATYVPEATDALEFTASGGTAVLVAPVSEAAIAAAGELGLRFPSKTTFFVPKPRAGLVMRTIAPPADVTE